VAGCCTPIANLLLKIYDLSVFESNLTNFIFFIMYIPSNFLSIFAINKWGTKSSIIIGVLFTLVGTWIRVFIMFSDSFMPFMVGCGIAAVG
jgi:FHS family L-fucose permease-like MFS transporter